MVPKIGVVSQVPSNEVGEKLVDLITKVFLVRKDEVWMESHLVNDFSADSIDYIELGSWLEFGFRIKIPDEDVEELTTVGCIYNYLAEKLGQPPAT